MGVRASQSPWDLLFSSTLQILFNVHCVLSVLQASDLTLTTTLRSEYYYCLFFGGCWGWNLGYLAC